MESGDSMERDGVWIPLTPGKPIPTRLGLGLGLHSVQPMGGRHNCKEELISGRGNGIENLNEGFPFIGSLNATGYMDRNGINEMYELKADAASGVAGKDPKSNAADQHDTSCVREEAVKVPHPEFNNKNAHCVHESKAGLGSTPSPSETKNSRKRRNDGIDLNKKPSQRPRMKKHRPKILDDSKPKKVPKAQTPRASTPRPKTPKPVTPNRVQERRKPARKNTFTSSTSYGYKDVVQDPQSAPTSSIIVVKSCKRSLDFNRHLVERESPYVSKSNEQPRRFNYDLGEYNYFGKIVTSKRNTPRRSRFQKKCLKASEDLSGDNNDQQCRQEISVVRNQELAERHVRRFVYFYHRRKKSIPTLKVYQRKFRANQCLQNSKKSGPNFPSIFKKRRAKRRKGTMIGTWWYVKAFEDGKNHVKRSHRKHVKTTGKSVRNRVDKSKDHKEAVKPDERFLRVFLTQKRKRSIRNTRRRENIMDFPIFKAISYESEKRRENIMDLSIFKAMPYESEKCLSLQEEDFLEITECFPLQEVPIQTIESFTAPHRNFQLVDNYVLSKEELNNLYARELGELVRWNLENLDINAECKQLVVRNSNFSGTLVKTDPPKKRKLIPKVDLDEETGQHPPLQFTYKRRGKDIESVEAADGSEPVEETNKEKEEWWERQMKVFRGRVDSFIAKMHLIQDIKFDDVKSNADSQAKIDRFLEFSTDERSFVTRHLVDEGDDVVYLGENRAKRKKRKKRKQRRKKRKRRKKREGKEESREEEVEMTGEFQVKASSVAAKKAAQAELARRGREKRKGTLTTGSGVLKRTKMTVPREPSSKVGDSSRVVTPEKAKVSIASAEKTRTSSDAIDATPVSSAPPAKTAVSPTATSTPSSADKGKGPKTGGVEVMTVNSMLPSDFMADNVLDGTKLFPHLGKYQLPSFRERFQGVSVEETGSHVAGLAFMAFQSSMALHAETTKIEGLVFSALERENVALDREKAALARIEDMSIRLDDAQNETEAVGRARDEANYRLKQSLSLIAEQRDELDKTKESLAASEKEAEESKSRVSVLEGEVKELRDEAKTVFALARLTARAAIMRQHLSGKNPLASASDELAFFVSSVGTERDLDSDDENEVEEEEMDEGSKGEASGKYATDVHPQP